MKVTIVFDDTKPEIVSALGENIGDSLAEDLGYPVEVHNPDYVPAVGPENIVDPAWVQPENYDPSVDEPDTIPNPDHVPAVGTPIIPNPETKGEYVGRVVLKDAIIPYLFTKKEKRAIKKTMDAIKMAKDAVAVATDITAE